MRFKNTQQIKTSHRTISEQGRFVLVPVEIDGSINMKPYTFVNYKDLQNRLPSLLMTFEARGEWEVLLYHVPNDFKWRWDRNLMCYFPNKGKKVLKYSYMDLPIDSMVIHTDSIHLNYKLLETSSQEKTTLEGVVKLKRNAINN